MSFEVQKYESILEHLPEGDRQALINYIGDIKALTPRGVINLLQTAKDIDRTTDLYRDLLVTLFFDYIAKRPKKHGDSGELTVSRVEINEHTAAILLEHLKAHYELPEDVDTLPDFAYEGLLWAKLGYWESLSGNQSGAYRIFKPDFDGAKGATINLGVYKPCIEEQFAEGARNKLKKWLFSTVLRWLADSRLHTDAGQGAFAEAASAVAGQFMQRAAESHIKKIAYWRYGVQDKLRGFSASKGDTLWSRLGSFLENVEITEAELNALDMSGAQQARIERVAQFIADKDQTQHYQVYHLLNFEGDEAANVRDYIQKATEDGERPFFVPPTEVVNLELAGHARCADGALGSFQQWLPNNTVTAAEGYGCEKRYTSKATASGSQHRAEQRVPRALFDMNAVLDGMTLNCDRHAENWFWRTNEQGQIEWLYFIDGGWAFLPYHPGIFALTQNLNRELWSRRPEAHEHFAPFSKAMISYITRHQGEYTDQVKKIYDRYDQPKDITQGRINCVHDMIYVLDIAAKKDKTKYEVAGVRTEQEVAYFSNRISKKHYAAAIVAGIGVLGLAAMTFGVGLPLILFTAGISGGITSAILMRFRLLPVNVHVQRVIGLATVTLLLMAVLLGVGVLGSPFFAFMINSLNLSMHAANLAAITSAVTFGIIFPAIVSICTLICRQIQKGILSAYRKYHDRRQYRTSNGIESDEHKALTDHLCLFIEDGSQSPSVTPGLQGEKERKDQSFGSCASEESSSYVSDSSSSSASATLPLRATK